MNKLIENHLKKIYQDEYKEEYLTKILNLINAFNKIKNSKMTEKDVFLITYADILKDKKESNITTLHKFLNKKLKKEITNIHFLPFFPSSSDDGFSVIDYYQIEQSYGNWQDVKKISNDYKMMFDFVANHVSQKNAWFLHYLKENPQYQNWFFSPNAQFDTSEVVRPRTTPLIHSYGSKKAWTTFSRDQVDLNYREFNVLLESIKILMLFIENGATAIRLDAIGFIWKTSATTCIHLPEAHEIIKLWRTIIDQIAPNTQLITETNVPHKENISYFGNGYDEAHQVYNFALPPLVLHSFKKGNAQKLNEWAKTIKLPSNNVTFFNFLASHDGIGMRPTEGILTEDEREKLFKNTIKNGGKLNYKNNADGTQSVYEMNITYYDALKDNNHDKKINYQKFLAAHFILLSFVGVPAIYYISLFGENNYYTGVEKSGINRRINRQKFSLQLIMEKLENAPRNKYIFKNLKKLISIRQKEQAFNPYFDQKIISLDERIFANIRFNNDEQILSIVNVSDEIVNIQEYTGLNLLTNKKESINQLKPYEYVWLKL